jgi:phosphatidylserine/phosphatidylglycerophosphate/cardiolipin synthase-like enzyme
VASSPPARSPNAHVLATSVVVVLTLAACVATAPPTAAQAVPTAQSANSTATPEIVGALPNPAAADDEGEYVAVATAGRHNLTLSDGEDVVPVPAGGRVVLSPSPDAVAPGVDGRVVSAPLSLSNAGERLVLRQDGRPVDRLVYEDAPTAERVVATADGRTWRPVGLDPRTVRRHGSAPARGFVLPDSPAAPLDPIRRADERVLLAGYTFSSRRVADALVAAARRGADVRVLVDGSPVGGVDARQATVLDRLVAAGVAVRVVDGERAPVAYHHPKYAVADGAAVVTTENWKPAGTGGESSRGWGVVVRSRSVADDLASLFVADASGPGTTAWADHRRDESLQSSPPANGSYPAATAPAEFRADVSVLTAPGNAGAALRERIASADERVFVVQPTVGRDSALLDATLAAADRGVDVRILLSNAWYLAEENRALADALNARAERRDVPLAVRVAVPRGRYEKIHAKGVVVDDAAVVGSLNWNRHAVTENREVAVVLEGESAAAYYAAAFERDWTASGDQSGRAPRLFLLCVAVVVGVAGAALKRRF